MIEVFLKCLICKFLLSSEHNLVSLGVTLRVITLSIITQSYDMRCLETEMCKELSWALNAPLKQCFLSSSVYLNFFCLLYCCQLLLLLKFPLEICFPPLNLSAVGLETRQQTFRTMCETGINRFWVGALWVDRWPFSYVFASYYLFQLVRSLVYSLLSSQSFLNGSSRGFRFFQFCLNYCQTTCADFMFKK